MLSKLLFLTLLACLTIQTTKACSCEAMTKKEKLKRSDFTVVARVVGVDNARDQTDKTVFTVKLKKVLKGKPWLYKKTLVQIKTNSNSALCGVSSKSMKVGGKYLIAGGSSDDDKWSLSIDSCTSFIKRMKPKWLRRFKRRNRRIKRRNRRIKRRNRRYLRRLKRRNKNKKFRAWKRKNFRSLVTDEKNNQSQDSTFLTESQDQNDDLNDQDQDSEAFMVSQDENNDSDDQNDDSVIFIQDENNDSDETNKDSDNQKESKDENNDQEEGK